MSEGLARELPWVSRKLYRLIEQRCADLETERRLLLNRLAEKGGFRIVYTESGSEMENTAVTAGSSAPLAVANSAQDDRVTEPENLRVTIDDVLAWGDRHVRRRAIEQGKMN